METLEEIFAQRPEYVYTESDMLLFTKYRTAATLGWKYIPLKQIEDEYLTHLVNYVREKSNNFMIKRLFYKVDAQQWYHLFRMEQQYRKSCILIMANMPGMKEEDFDIPKIPMKIFLDVPKL